jgi:hypothetical protein
MTWNDSSNTGRDFGWSTMHPKTSIKTKLQKSEFHFVVLGWDPLYFLCIVLCTLKVQSTKSTIFIRIICTLRACPFGFFSSKFPSFQVLVLIDSWINLDLRITRDIRNSGLTHTFRSFGGYEWVLAGRQRTEVAQHTSTYKFEVNPSKAIKSNRFGEIFNYQVTPFDDGRRDKSSRAGQLQI